MNEYDDLLRKCAEGEIEESQRLNALIAAFAKPYINRLRQDGFSECDIEDASQEIWVKAYTAIRNGHGPIGYALKSWTKTIAIRECVNCVRRRILDRKYFCPADSVPDSELTISDDELRERLEKIAVARTVLESFHGKERQILSGIIRGLTTDELSAETGLPQGTLKRKKARVLAEAKRRGRKLWEGGTDEPDQ